MHTCTSTTRTQVYENPLAEFVELPPQYQGLNYSNLLCGVIRGALEMVRAACCCLLGGWWWCVWFGVVCLVSESCHDEPPTEPYATQIKYRVECRFVKDTLKGDDVNEIRWVDASIIDLD